MGLNIIDMCDRTQHILRPQYLNIEANFQGIYIDKISLGALSALGYALFSIISLVSILLIVWTLKNRTSRPVQASQPFFMTMLCIGSFIMASAMIPMSIDDQQSQYSADIACMSIPWLLSVGFCTIFSALFTKTWRLVKIVESAARFRRVTVTVKDVLYPFFGLLIVNIIILTCWTTINPLAYRRQLQDAALSSVGRCLSSSDAKGGATPYLVSLAALNGSMLILANWMAYRSRKVHMEFNESRYIAFVMFSILQAFLIGIPLLCAVLRDPVPYYIVLIMLDFIICCSTLCFMFIPKVLAHRKKLSCRDGTTTSATTVGSVENRK
jgi:gamma-aminobutyric acid type B receptor